MTATFCLLSLAMTMGQADKAMLKAKLDDHAGERWIYDDLNNGFAAAKSSGKPLLVVLRCTK